MIAIIVAKSKNNVIGRGNIMPWRQHNDLQRFKSLTLGHTVIMGRKTYESIGKPLPDRSNIIITGDRDNFIHTHRETLWPLDRDPAEVYVDYSLGLSLRQFEVEPSYPRPTCLGFVIGGGSLYEQTMDRADIMYVTELDCVIEDGDTFFPDIDLTDWKKVAEEKYPSDGIRNQYNYSFVTYKRIKKH
jgi:dihydrofolate reductase